MASVDGIRGILTGKQGDGGTAGAVRAEAKDDWFKRQLMAAINPNAAGYTNANPALLPGLLSGDNA